LKLFDNLSKNRGFLIVLGIIFLVQIVFSMFGGKLLRTVPLLAHEWLYILAMSLIIIPFDLIRKLILVPFLPLKNILILNHCLRLKRTRKTSRSFAIGHEIVHWTCESS